MSILDDLSGGVGTGGPGGGGGGPGDPGGGGGLPGQAPLITSDALVMVTENAAGPAYLAIATDPAAGDIPVWSISGGADAAQFVIDPSSGVVSFAANPDYEAPADADHNNLYELQLVVTGAGGADTKAITISVTDVNEAPAVTSGATASTVENTAGAVYVAAAADPDVGDHLTWSISGGADAGLMKVDAASGAVSFVAAPDFAARFTPGWTLADAVKAATAALGGPDRQLEPASLEVAILADGHGRRAFQRISDGDVAELLGR